MGLNSFYNSSSDVELLKSLEGSVVIDQDELCKAMNRAGLVQKDVQVRGKNGKTFTRKQWVRASDVVKDNTSSSKTGGPVDISKFSFTNYRNPDGQNRNGYNTYRDSLQSVANETEKAATRVLSTYGGSMKPYDQLRIEFSNINGHSSYRDMISNSSEQGLKDAKSAILARQKELCESVKDYTKWDSTQRKWVKDDSQSSSSSQKKTDTNDNKNTQSKTSAQKKSDANNKNNTSSNKSLSQMSESELKDRMKQVTTRMSELSKEINSNGKAQGQLNSVATQAQKKEYDELVEENGNLMMELGKRNSVQKPTGTNVINQKNGTVHHTDSNGNDFKVYTDNQLGTVKMVGKFGSDYKTKLIEGMQKKGYEVDKQYTGKLPDGNEQISLKKNSNPVQQPKSKKDTTDKDVLDSKLNPYGYKVGDYLKVKQGRSYTTYQVKSLEKSKDISGKEHVYLNCIEIMKNGQVYNFNHIILADSKLISYKIDEPLTLKDPSGKRSKDNFQQTSSGSKLSPADAKAKTKEVTKNVTDRNAFIEKAKAQGITWKENDHAGINWMRCCMAMNKHFENGGSFDAKDFNKSK